MYGEEGNNEQGVEEKKSKEYLKSKSPPYEGQLLLCMENLLSN